MDSWQEYESKARKAMEKLMNVQLSSVKIAINGKFKNFDLINLEHKIVGDIKHYTMTSGGNRPSAKFSVLNEYVWLMGLLEKYDNKPWKKLFVIGEDRRMADLYIREFDRWLDDIEFYFYSEKTGVVKIR